MKIATKRLIFRKVEEEDIENHFMIYNDGVLTKNIGVKYMNTITNYYESYDEESRITSSKSRKIEFRVTTNVLNKYINKNDKILEVGAGTGVYSFSTQGGEMK